MMKKKEIICDHCKYPILKDGVSVITEWFDDVNYLGENEGDLNFYHQKCLIAAIELMVIHKYVKS